MKMSVSLTLLHIFRKYLMVVYDLWETLASTYGRIVTPQAINLLGEAGGEGAQQPVDGAHQDAAQRNHEEAGDAEEGVGHRHRARVRELLEQVVQNLREEQRLPEHQDVEQLVDVDLLEHGQHGHGVHGRHDGAEQQAGQQVHAGQLGAFDLAHAVDHAADEEGVPQRAHHGEHQDGAHVLREGPDGQEVAGVEDDGGQQVEEEELRVEHGRLLPDGADDAAHQQPDADQQAALGHHAGHPREDVEPCGEETGFRKPN
ncbi:hypothetical protein EYF80_046565 [Liparis tanakae]|uniref:Uncharacterized protein n=1 Tax=Liparis tanakae TaxID=230148 RepID=A0A4Z2FQ14_9TELE|nr:hypothetical protein EYF80_046565 [Liparis tanakae]